MYRKAGGIGVNAIPGTHTVLFGMDATEAARRGLLGFALGKRDGGGQIRWMNGFKFFEKTLPDPAPGTLKPTIEHPIQDFQWSDYNAEPGTTSAYVIQPLYGKPDALEKGRAIDMEVATANAEGDRQSIHFNRGVVPSQAFARRFGNSYPDPDEQADPDNPKTQWLSRGLLEAALAFIGEARGQRFELRVAAYEFTYRPILHALKEAAGTGAQIRISFKAGDRRANGDIYQDETSLRAWEAILADDLRLQTMSRKGLTLHPRTWYGGIPHNKFMVLLENGTPVAVWTGSTNFTCSGFLGQSNVAHVIRDQAIAATYNAYWEQLETDPPVGELRAFATARQPDPAVPPDEPAVAVFSPRQRGMLEWYAERLSEARQSAFLTAAFGVLGPVADAFMKDVDFLRFILAENEGRHASTRAAMRKIQEDFDNIVAFGTQLAEKSIRAGLPGERLDRWFLREERHRRTGHIFFVHTKFMMVDALSAKPLLFTGSANFSDASVFRNDENMLVLSGDWAKEAVPVYLNEFMRLHRHLYFRTVALRLAERGTADARRGAKLEPTDKWVKDHFNPRRLKHKKRILFRGKAA